MNLSSRAIALQGVGFGPACMALAGWLPVAIDPVAQVAAGASRLSSRQGRRRRLPLPGTLPHDPLEIQLFPITLDTEADPLEPSLRQLRGRRVRDAESIVLFAL